MKKLPYGLRRCKKCKKKWENCVCFGRCPEKWIEKKKLERLAGEGRN